MTAPGVSQGDALDVTCPGIRAVSARNARSDQQDAVLIRPWLVAVADGLGGHPAGASASVAALTALDAAIPGPAGPRRLRDGCEAADAAVRALAAGSGRNPGTTLVAAVVDPAGSVVHGMWSGDSRAWLVTASKVELLTDDHVDPLGGLTACLGDHGDHAHLHVGAFTLAAADGRLLLTTDGTHGPLDATFEDPEELHRLLDHGLDKVVAAATALGTDNATAIAVDLRAFSRAATATN